MTKTKMQLRAEAVERLKANKDEIVGYAESMLGVYDDAFRAMGNGKVTDMLIDLLEDDDMDSAVCVQKCPNDELPYGDAAALLRDWLDYKINRFDAEANAIILNTGADPDKLYEIADMIERDYVRRDGYDFMADALKYMKAERDKLGAEYDKDVLVIVDELDGWKTRAVKLEAERDEWKAKAEQAQESYLDAKSDRDTWHARYVTLQKGQSKARAGQSNLEWLYMHDSELAGYVDGCVFNKGYVSIDTLQWAHEWLMAPHEDANDVFSGESVVTPETVDANDVNATQDSREKLEADVRDWMHEHIIQPHDSVSKVLEWLDRQACITYGETIHTYNIAAREARKVQEKRITEQRDQVDYLTEKLEAAYAKNSALKAHISKMQEGRHGWHIKAAKLQAQVDKLTAECGECVYKQEFASIDELQEKVDALTQANCDLRDEWHRVCCERDELRRELTKSNREREQLRKQLGIAIDHAHDMIALVSVDTDEGTA